MTLSQMDEDGHEPVKPSLELVAVDGQLAVIVSSLSSHAEAVS